MSSLIRPALALFGLFTLLTGAAYPAIVTGLAQAVFPMQANGSLIRDGNNIVGSQLIGQPFTKPGYFWSRPSATAPHPYNGGASTGSNLGPTNPALREAITARVAALHTADPGNRTAVPIDLVTTSASGLDPHVSPAAALYQVSRVANARGLPESRVRTLVEEFVEGRQLGVLGEPTVNVLRLNRGLDDLAHSGG